MSDSATPTRAWSAGLSITARTQFQAVAGSIWIATGASAPVKLIAGNAIPAGKAVEIDGPATVYWRTDEAAPVTVSWLVTGA